MDLKHCPNCDKKLEGFLSSRFIIPQDKIDLINLFHSPAASMYCNSCATEIIEKTRSELYAQKESLYSVLNADLHIIPIITTHSPLNWDYAILGMVSAQSVSGTGFLSELSGSWADFTGGQSNTMMNKVSSGEDICKDKLRYQCARLGGNAIIATDIDYSEVGGAKGMLMVCMAGTAVDLDINSAMFSMIKPAAERLKKNADELVRISSIKFPSI